ncbi:hypothetical protein B0F90DRAFT_1729750 [Multifurca ochricompacta]|uniref:Pentatricopeptide repeat-containing protein n=1 Tax=Multifurca ochricompacta TaxID=376703 RepID=A0AAD4M1Z5_9AGAM|nr:hypothetical protein B0F90DRAFT_1729750 [Multifurca ochricompacta]
MFLRRTSLPSGLLDLVILRVYAPSLSHVSMSSQRWMQQAALVSQSSSTFSEPPAVTSPRGRRRQQRALSPLSSPARASISPGELARRVQALAVPTENQNVPSNLTYDEEELLHMLSALLQQRAEPASPRNPSQTESQAYGTSLGDGSSSLLHHVALSLLIPIITNWRVYPITHVILRTRSISTNGVPLAVLSVEEWRSLTRVCKSMRTMLWAGMQERGCVRSGTVYADIRKRCDTTSTELSQSNIRLGPLTDRQRHLHIKAHEKSVPAGTVPESSLSLLHAYENAGRPAPMTAYSRILAALFRTPSSLAHAQAWDIFSHMRYVAHPHPDALLFTQMIHACALPTPAEPERALDLFTEMTIDRGIQPTAGAYTAAILACARSGSKTYVNEAFRLAKEMLDSHRDARGRGAFRPDSHTFSALLEGAKRIGDLSRVRWILAEMVNAARKRPESKDIVVDERIMTHVFHAYATYKPPFKRSMAPLASEFKGNTGLSSTSLSSLPNLAGSSAVDYQLSAPVEALQNPSFSHLPPQSRSEVLGEARALFSRFSRPSFPSDPLPPLPDVHVTPRLLNAYLSVFYAHASLETAHEMFRTIFAEHSLEKDALTLVEALERCAGARRGPERASVSRFAEEAWGEWTALENSQVRVSARHVQRAYAARIRVLSLTSRLDEALVCLRAFATRYPPYTVREPPAQKRPDMRAMRVLLVGDRPLVRLTSALDIQDDDVPPLLTFADLEVLHHRLVATDNLRGIAYVKWVCKAYEGALQKRRQAALKV